MDYVPPAQIVSDAIAAAEKKAQLPVRDLLIRSALAGGLLGYATSFVFIALSQGLPGIVGAIIFPVGFVILVLLGLELATGNFALLPAALVDKRIGFGALMRNWTYALLFYVAITNFGTGNGGPLGDQLRAVAARKTLAYVALGSAGRGTAFVKGILCNWMVTLGAVLAFSSRSTLGKVVAMWVLITTFFAHGYEHSVVNMFAIPAGTMLGAKPITLGNIVGGASLTGIALWLKYAAKAPDSAPKPELAAPLAAVSGL